MSTVLDTAKKQLTASEFAQLPAPADGSRQELVRGEIVTMPPPGFEHGLVQANLLAILRAYVRQMRSGRVVGESGVITERDPDTVRGPDIAFWSAERLPLDQCPSGYPEVPPDLVVEIVSPSDSVADVQQKVLEYLTHGVRMVWVVEPRTRSLTVYRGLQDVAVLRGEDEVDGGEVLPGFRCPVKEVFQS